MRPARRTPTARAAAARAAAAVIPAILLLGACGDPGAAPAGETPSEADATTAAEAGAPSATRALSPEHRAFWSALEGHCGRAYPGAISDVTDHYREGLVGREIVAHFFDCSEDRMHVAFHLDDDRSRNWILTQVDGTIRLKHDHRHEDGTEDDISQYGGDAPSPGLPTRQIFPADAHTASILPERADNFWFFDLVTPDRLQYGVHWPKHGHSVRIEFDLSTPVSEPPAPWGY